MVNLEDYGWDSFFEAAQKEFDQDTKSEVGRVISVHKSRYEVVTSDGVFSCEILGKIQFANKEAVSPAVGDFVLLNRYRDTYTIRAVLTRKNYLTRQKKHDRFPKAFAANIDYAFVIQSVEEEDFNIKRLERILVHFKGENIKTAIVLNKIDRADEEGLHKLQSSLQHTFPHILIFLISVLKKKGIDELKSELVPSKTFIFIGSSGVGKSSLLNLLSGGEQAKTQEVSETTRKGKHTTSARRLYKLESGALIIDTPGTREFGMHSDDLAFEEAFFLISQYAKECFFSNCSHGREKGCAVHLAIEQGLISKEALDRYQELQHEKKQTPKEMRSSKNRYRGVSRSLRSGKRKKPRN